MFCQSFILSSLLALSGVLGAAVPSDNSSSACVNSPSTRSCWSDGFDISTDYYESVPDTGVTREYWFNIENGTASPDGVEIPVMTVNGSLPGPTIIADWGDWVGMCASEFYSRREKKMLTDSLSSRACNQCTSEQRNFYSLPWHQTKLYQLQRWRPQRNPVSNRSRRQLHIQVARNPIRVILVPFALLRTSMGRTVWRYLDQRPCDCKLRC